MRCLVIGGGGFIGTHLCRRLVAEGHQVRVMEFPHTHRSEVHFYQNVEWGEGDFTNRADVEAAIRGCEIVYHLVSTTLPKGSNENPEYDVESNLGASLRLMQLAVKHNVKKIIFTSSGGTVYGLPIRTPITEDHPTDPLCSYGIVKLAIEKYLALFHSLYGLDYCVLRLANPYGPGQRVNASQGAVAVFLHRAITGRPIEIWGDGSVVRDFIHIDDVIEALYKAIAYRGTSKVFNVGSGSGASLNELLDAIECVLGRPVAREYLPSRNFDVPISILDIAAARNHLNWQPKKTLVDGIGDTAGWLLRQNNA